MGFAQPVSTTPTYDGQANYRGVITAGAVTDQGVKATPSIARNQQPAWREANLYPFV
jgi:hypothetical protein